MMKTVCLMLAAAIPLNEVTAFAPTGSCHRSVQRLERTRVQSQPYGQPQANEYDAYLARLAAETAASEARIEAKKQQAQAHARKIEQAAAAYLAETNPGQAYANQPHTRPGTGDTSWLTDYKNTLPDQAPTAASMDNALETTPYVKAGNTANTASAAGTQTRRRNALQRTPTTSQTNTAAQTQSPSLGGNPGQADQIQELRTDDGTTYFYDPVTAQTAWTREELAGSGLPSTGSQGASQGATMDDGIDELRTEDGQTYYYHRQSQRTAWSREELLS